MSNRPINECIPTILIDPIKARDISLFYLRHSSNDGKTGIDTYKGTQLFPKVISSTVSGKFFVAKVDAIMILSKL